MGKGMVGRASEGECTMLGPLSWGFRSLLQAGILGEFSGEVQ